MERWNRLPDRPLVIAHRGASAELPENSMLAFRRAVSCADGVELDVRLSADGQLVIFHDDDLRRLCGQPASVEQLSLPSLRRMRIQRNPAAPLPLLAELFEELAPTELVVNVELKTTLGTRFALPAAVARAVAASGLADRVLISSFDPFALLSLRAADPSLPIGLLFHGQLARPLREAWAARGLRPFSLHPERRLVRPPAVERWRAAGYRIATWTVDKPRDWDRFRTLVDALITNDPDAATGFYRGTGTATSTR